MGCGVEEGTVTVPMTLGARRMRSEPVCIGIAGSMREFARLAGSEWIAATTSVSPFEFISTLASTLLSTFAAPAPSSTRATSD